MQIKYFVAFVLLFCWVNTFSQGNFDVVVYGGTPGGFTAAIQAAKMGKRVALLEPSGHVGGILVNGLGVTDIDSQPKFQNSVAVGGLALQFYRRIAKHYGRDAEFDAAIKAGIKNHDLWPHEPGVAEKIINAWLEENKVEVFVNARLTEDKDAVKKKKTEITRIKMENGQTFSARMFIDATYEGDLLAAAGISTVVGREGNAKYGERLNGIRAETTHAQFLVKVNPYVDPEDPGSGLIPTIQDEPLGTPGGPDKRIQAYCFRMCLTQDPENKIPILKPLNYDRHQYEIYVRYLKGGGNLLRPWVSVPNAKSDLGAWHDLSHNLYGMNMDYPEGNYATRKRVYQEHKDFTQGLFYFLANDPEVGLLDPELQKEWALWGLAKDEFTDNGGWPRMFYVRSARRMVSDYVITEHHILKPNPIPVEDPVGVAFWPTDVHSVRRIVKDGYAYNEGFVFDGDFWEPLPVSFRALVPKATECTNLLTPTCPSSSYIAYGAIRLEWTFMVLGQSAGAAAVMAIDQRMDIQKINYGLLKELLVKEGQILSLKK
ncbi:MAG TPA: FAD-dependent oxidoreductase [Chryseosolibacter sp.]